MRGDTGRHGDQQERPVPLWARAPAVHERAIRRCIRGSTTVTPAANKLQVRTSTMPPDSVPKLNTRQFQSQFCVAVHGRTPTSPGEVKLED